MKLSLSHPTTYVACESSHIKYRCDGMSGFDALSLWDARLPEVCANKAFNHLRNICVAKGASSHSFFEQRDDLLQEAYLAMTVAKMTRQDPISLGEAFNFCRVSCQHAINHFNARNASLVTDAPPSVDCLSLPAEDFHLDIALDPAQSPLNELLDEEEQAACQSDAPSGLNLSDLPPERQARLLAHISSMRAQPKTFFLGRVVVGVADDLFASLTDVAPESVERRLTRMLKKQSG